MGESQRRKASVNQQFNSLDIRQAIAEVINEKMEQDDWSGRGLESISGVNEITIRRLRKGEQNISIELLYRICIALDISMADLFAKAGV